MVATAQEMVALCRDIDEHACRAYATLAMVSSAPELKHFWTRMSQEERRHVQFWKALENSHVAIGMEYLLADATKSLKELRKAAADARLLADESSEIPDLRNALILAYRMEFSLLHPAFGLFFHLVPSGSDIRSPEAEYDAHISRFTDMLAKQGHVSPELQLLGDTLHQLWTKNRMLAIESSHDYLTGLYNRRGFKVVATQLAHLAHRNNTTVGVMMLDLDDFKTLNDKLGHAAGDSALKKVSRTLTGCLRASDIICRHGGEEFAIWLSSINKGDTGNIAELIREAIEQDNKDASLTVSIGFTESTVGSDIEREVEQLLLRGDRALYSAKRHGKNGTAEYDPISHGASDT